MSITGAGTCQLVLIRGTGVGRDTQMCKDLEGHSQRAGESL